MDGRGGASSRTTGTVNARGAEERRVAMGMGRVSTRDTRPTMSFYGFVVDSVNVSVFE